MRQLPHRERRAEEKEKTDAVRYAQNKKFTYKLEGMLDFSPLFSPLFNSNIYIYIGKLLVELAYEANFCWEGLSRLQVSFILPAGD